MAGSGSAHPSSASTTEPTPASSSTLSSHINSASCREPQSTKQPQRIATSPLTQEKLQKEGLQVGEVDFVGRDSFPSTASLPRPAAPKQKACSSADTLNSATLKEPATGSLQPSFSNDSRVLLDSFRPGQGVLVTLKDGARFSGGFVGTTYSTLRLSMVSHKKKSVEPSNESDKKDTSNMSFQKREASIGGKGDVKTNGNSAAFRTDSAISSARAGRERVLQPWVAPSGSEEVDLSLEKGSSGVPWDQFKANERQFGIKTSYDENIYTTPIDKNHPHFKERMAAADKKAREIERSAATTAHVAEERKMDFAGGDDANGNEEDKYSGVKRQDLPVSGSRENKYTPPARRAAAGTSTVKGAPVDPAIISSQLKMQKSQRTQPEEAKIRTATAPKAESSSPAPPPVRTPEPKVEAKVEVKSVEPKSHVQTSTPLKPTTTTSRTISPQAKDSQGATPSATSTVERDVLKEFKTFANQQRITVEKVRSNKARMDKEVKLTELRKFADNFKLPTPVPKDLIMIIAKDPVKQKEIQEKAMKDAAELAKRKAEEAALKDKKAALPKDSQPPTTSQAAADARPPRSVSTAQANAASSGVQARHGQGNRSSFVPPSYPSFPNSRSGPSHMAQTVRQGGGLANRIRANEAQKAQNNDMRLAPTGPANGHDPSFGRRMGAMANHMGGKLNPNSHEFRPSAFQSTLGPNGHPSAGSSPRSAVNNANETPSNATATVVTPVLAARKSKAIDAKKCNILSNVKAIQPPENKNWSDNDGLRPSFDTPPTWRTLADDEKPDSTMHMSCDDYFERQPFTAQRTPNPPNLVPQHVPHQHQLPLHMQHGPHQVGPRHSPHGPPVQMHGVQHGPVPHAPFSGVDDHRMMHSNSSQSFSSPRLGQIPMAYPSTMHGTPQMPYNQQMMPPFMGPGAQQMNQLNRSFSNNPQYVAQQPGGMGSPMMMQPQFMTPQGMVSGPPQMPMYAPQGHFVAPGGAPQTMPGNNGYPSPGRPAAPMMVHQSSQQGQPMFAQSPNIQYQQPFPPQQGQMSMRQYSNAGPQHFGTSPQQIHQYGTPHRNGSNNFNKGYQGHNQHHGPQGGHAIPSGPQGRASEGPDEAK